MRRVTAALGLAALVSCTVAKARAQQVAFDNFTEPPLRTEVVDGVGDWSLVVYRREGADKPEACSAFTRAAPKFAAAEIGPPALLLTIWPAAPGAIEPMIAFDSSATPLEPDRVELSIDAESWSFFSQSRRDAWWPEDATAGPMLGAIERAGVAEIRAWSRSGSRYPVIAIHTRGLFAALQALRHSCGAAGRQPPDGLEAPR